MIQSPLPHVLREYSLIADGERGALIGPDGAISWLCAPRWDSPRRFRRKPRVPSCSAGSGWPRWRTCVATAPWPRTGSSATARPAALYTEEYDVHQRQLRGNLPQAFVHAGLLESAVALSRDPLRTRP
jgi:hypothetical protein